MLMWKRNARLKRKRRTIIFNVDVARRRKSGSSQVRAGERCGAGRRWLAPVGAGVLVVCVCVAAIRGGGGLKPAGSTVRWIEVSNEELFSKERIRALAGVKVGDNLFSEDLQKIRARICVHPDIKDAIVSRRMPGGIVIRVYERFPIAAVFCPVLSAPRQLSQPSGSRPQSASAKVVIPSAVPGRGSSPGPEVAAGSGEGERMRRYVVDAEGFVLSAKKERNSKSLPLLLGLKLGPVRPGDRLWSPAAKNALGIVEHYRESDLSRQLELTSVDASDPDNYLMRSDAIQEIRLGRENLGERLQLLSFILKQRKYRGHDGPASYIDLRWKDVAELPLASGIVAKR